MELRLPHIIRLYNVFRENDGKENCAQLIEEEFNKSFSIMMSMIAMFSRNSLNIHDANDMQSHKLGDAMFDEDDIFSPPRFDVQICYNDCMPPFYDDYNDESGFGEVMTLFSDESTILDEASIDYEDKVAIYDDYGDDMKNNDNHETCHHDFNFQFPDSYFVEFAPTTINEKKFAYVESKKISMLVDHEKNALCDSFIV